jgi:hypothetical protein
MKMLYLTAYFSSFVITVIATHYCHPICTENSCRILFREPKQEMILAAVLGNCRLIVRPESASPDTCSSSQRTWSTVAPIRHSHLCLSLLRHTPLNQSSAFFEVSVPDISKGPGTKLRLLARRGIAVLVLRLPC